MMGWQPIDASNRRCVTPLAVRVALIASAILLSSQASAGQTATASLTREQIREFLLTAKIVKSKSIPTGVTRPVRLTLSDGTLTHDAAFSTVDEHRNIERFSSGRVELDFVDSYKYSLAAYKLAELLGLDGMMPVHVERAWEGRKGALAWWVDAAQMTEGERLKKKIEVPNPSKWNEQMYRMRVFSQLVADTDRNVGNILIDADWTLWMIDFTRAFRPARTLQYPDEVMRADRTLLANLRALNRETLRANVGKWLENNLIDAVLARRDVLVGLLDKEIAAKGEAAVLYDLPRVTEPCGTGLGS
jgi:hypothetical protein